LNRYATSRSPLSGAVVIAALITAASFYARPAVVFACPFCTAIEPSLSQQRDASAVVLLAEITSGGREPTFEVHRILKAPANRSLAGKLALPVEVGKPGGLVILLGAGAAEQQLKELSWKAVDVTETSYGYFTRLPSAKAPPAERLAYVGRYLEHPDQLIAKDAYLEFGHAPLDAVKQAAAKLPMARMRAWLVDERVPQERKGFYGLALGLAVDPRDRQKNAEILKQLILKPSDDFRAGFDGALSGYVLLEGNAGLALIEKRYLSNPSAKHGDVRHALAMLRFCHEYCPNVEPRRVVVAMRRLLERSDLADQAVIDLARWQDWESAEVVSDLYTKDAPRALRSAIVGYLRTCQTDIANRSLARLRKIDPTGVAAAEAELSQLNELGK